MKHAYQEATNNAAETCVKCYELACKLAIAPVQSESSAHTTTLMG